MASCGLKVVVLLLVSLFATIDCHVQESVSDHNHDYSNEHQHLNEEHSHTHHQHEHGDNDPDVSQSGTSCTETEATWQELFLEPSMRQAFYNAMLASIGVGIFPILCVCFVTKNEQLLKILLAFAAGGLMGDVFLHLLPQGLDIYSKLYTDTHSHSHSHSHSHDDHDDHDDHSGHNHSHNTGHSILGLYIIIGFFIFFLLEKTFHEMGHSHNHSHSGHHGHTHSDDDDCDSDLDDDENDKNENTPQSKTNPKLRQRNKNKSKNKNKKNKKNKVSKEKKFEKQKEANIEAHKMSVKLLNILADFTHNFTDGLTIAASFILSTKMGFIQTVAIFLHEVMFDAYVPHEIGDYAILIENGMSWVDAMKVQVITAIGCIFGTFLGFVFENNSDLGTKWIIPFTSGGFIYIACVQVMPTLVERDFGVKQSLFQAWGFAAGVVLMIAVGWLEENIDHFL